MAAGDAVDAVQGGGCRRASDDTDRIARIERVRLIRDHEDRVVRGGECGTGVLDTGREGGLIVPGECLPEEDRIAGVCTDWLGDGLRGDPGDDRPRRREDAAPFHPSAIRLPFLCGYVRLLLCRHCRTPFGVAAHTA
ncbi:MAG TPA: hypothetical protein VIC60_03070 [Thermomicrobiales bacterium]